MFNRVQRYLAVRFLAMLAISILFFSIDKPDIGTHLATFAAALLVIIVSANESQLWVDDLGDYLSKPVSICDLASWLSTIIAIFVLIKYG